MDENQQRGATSVEYSLLVFFVASVIFGAVALVGRALVPGFDSIVRGL